MSFALTHKFSNAFVTLCDRYLYPGWQRNDAILFRARTLIGLLIVYQGIVISGAIFALFFSSLPQTGNFTAVSILIGLSFCFYLLMHYLTRSGELMRSAHIAVATTFVGVEAGILVSGGPMLTPSLGLAVVPAVVAFCVIGRRAGLAWAAIACVTQLLLVLLDSLGVHYLNLILPEQMAMNRLFNWLVMFSAVVGIVLVYENANSHLQRDRDRQYARFQHLALHDALTGLANRKQFTDRVRQALASLQRSNKVLAVVYLDLNGFKQINDTLGHEAGDRALQIVAQRLQHTVRKCDTVARIGGDEFALLLEDAGEQGDVEYAVMRLQEALSIPMEEFRDFPIRGSFGVALAPHHASETEALLLMADKAMYDAKKRQQTFCVYDPQSQPLNLELARAKKIRLVSAAETSPPADVTVQASANRAWSRQLQRWFVDHCNRFLPPQFHDSTDLLFRGRIVIGCLRASQIVLAVFMLNLATLNDLPPQVRLLIGAMLAALFVLFGTAPSYVRHTGKLTVVSTFLVACIFASIEAGIFVTGGPAVSTTLDLAVVPALAAFCLVGRQHGYTWAALAVAANIGMLVAENVFGYQLPLLRVNQQVDTPTVVNWLVFFCCTVGIVFVYELLNQRLQRDRDRQREQIEYLATHDQLTGVANRRKFLDVLNLAVERMRRNNGTVAVAYIDLDGFKPVNDTLGHDVGDLVLKTIAQRLNENVRSMDTVARLGGDEFGIIMENVGDLDNAISFAHKVQQIVSQPIAGLEALPLGGSVGVAMAPLHSTDGNTLVRMADHAMFRAKSGAGAVAAYEA